jgi:hypothetical protein
VTINWGNFLTVIVASLVAASLLVTLFSLGLRLADGEAPWRKPVSVAMFVLCGLLVATGIFLIVPALHSAVLG